VIEPNEKRLNRLIAFVTHDPQITSSSARLERLGIATFCSSGRQRDELLEARLVHRVREQQGNSTSYF